MIAIDIGGSHISSLEVTDVLGGKVNGDLRNDHVSVVEFSKDEILDAWSRNINLTIESSNLFDGNIAIAFPGPFDYNTGMVMAHPNHKFSQLEGINIKKKLSDRLNSCKRIHFQNDASCFGIGEYYYGQKEKSTKILALTIGTGIGSSFIDQGKVVRDSDRVPYGGEIYNIPFEDLSADDYFSTRWFVCESAKYSQHVSGVRELIEYGRKDLVDIIFNKFVENFKIFFTPLALDFDAKAIVVGGNITKAWSYFGPQISTHFREVGIQVMRSNLGEKAICLGAARSMYNHQKL